MIVAVVAMLLGCWAVAAHGAAATQPTTDKAEPQPAQVSPDAEALLQKMSAAYRKLEGLELTGTIGLQVEEAGQKHAHQTRFSSSYAAPNKFRHQASGEPLWGSTGQKLFGYSARRNAFTQADPPEGRMTIRQLPGGLANILLDQNLSLAMALAEDPSAELKELCFQITSGPDETIDGKPYALLRLKLRNSAETVVLLLDPATSLIRRVTMDRAPEFAKRGRPDITVAIYSVNYVSVKPNGIMQAEQFAWAAPEGSRDLAAVRPALAEDDEDEPSLALVGKPAPDFTLEGIDGNKVKLSDLKGSVVVLDFWATWCGPCVASMPALDKLYQDNSADGLKVFALNQEESKETVRDFLQENKLKLPVLLDSDAQVSEQYMVRGIPTTFVVGKDGVIKKVQIGFNPDDDELSGAVIEQLKAGPDR